MAKTEINPALEKAVNDLLETVTKDEQASVNDKVKVIDRALKLEAIKLKLGEDWGSGFGEGEEEEKGADNE